MEIISFTIKYIKYRLLPHFLMCFFPFKILQAILGVMCSFVQVIFLPFFG